MNPKISVEPLAENQFCVIVSEGSTQTTHRVTVSSKDYERVSTGKVSKADLVRMSFEFLLEHESKESILRQFHLMEIASYFPSFEKEISRRVSQM